MREEVVSNELLVIAVECIRIKGNELGPAC
jgi:hypothetical protein